MKGHLFPQRFLRFVVSLCLASLHFVLAFPSPKVVPSDIVVPSRSASVRDEPSKSATDKAEEEKASDASAFNTTGRRTANPKHGPRVSRNVCVRVVAKCVFYLPRSSVQLLTFIPSTSLGVALGNGQVRRRQAGADSCQRQSQERIFPRRHPARLSIQAAAGRQPHASLAQTLLQVGHFAQPQHGRRTCFSRVLRRP